MKIIPIQYFLLYFKQSKLQTTSHSAKEIKEQTLYESNLLKNGTKRMKRQAL